MAAAAGALPVGRQLHIDVGITNWGAATMSWVDPADIGGGGVELAQLGVPEDTHHWEMLHAPPPPKKKKRGGAAVEAEVEAKEEAVEEAGERKARGRPFHLHALRLCNLHSADESEMDQGNAVARFFLANPDLMDGVTDVIIEDQAYGLATDKVRAVQLAILAVLRTFGAFVRPGLRVCVIHAGERLKIMGKQEEWREYIKLPARMPDRLKSKRLYNKRVAENLARHVMTFYGMGDTWDIISRMEKKDDLCDAFTQGLAVLRDPVRLLWQRARPIPGVSPELFQFVHYPPPSPPPEEEEDMAGEAASDAIDLD
jgi:hypothetical protein